MSVTKRTRFEILRRDNHSCRYCGAAAPDVVLHVDHVTPVSLGGSDDPSNLVTACRDCNTGKASTSPNENIIADVSEKALALSEAFKVALTSEVKNIEAQSEYQGLFYDAWNSWKCSAGAIELPIDWADTLSQWFAIGVPFEIVQNAIDVAMTKRNIRSRDGEFRYMCGVVWRTLDKAQQSISQENAPEPLPQGFLVTTCVNEGCDTPAIFEDGDEHPPQCAGCEGAAQWQGGWYHAETRANRNHLFADLVTLHIDGVESSISKSLRLVS